MKKSAYFPNSDDSSTIAKEKFKDKYEKYEDKNSFDRYNATKSTVHTMSGISFPFNQSVLWNREVISYPSYMNSTEVIQALYLSNHDIKLLLSQLNLKPKQNIECSVNVKHYNDLPDIDKKSVGISLLGIPKYILRINHKTSKTLYDNSLLTVPIIYKESIDNKIEFDEESTK